MKLIFLWVLYPLIRPFYLLSLILNTVILALIIIAISPFDRKGNLVHYIGKFWSLLNIYSSGTKLAIKGKEKIERDSVFFVDDNIVGKPSYAKEFFRALIPLNVKWFSQASLSVVKDRELLDLAQRSGCRGIFIGFESLS